METTPSSQPPPGAGPSAQAEVLESLRQARDAAVLAEMDRLQNQKSGWLAKLGTLAVSLFLFVALGLFTYKSALVDILILTAVVGIHELGHYAGMRIFGYRDVRMFFLPLFGGMTSGRGGDIAGWKRAVVALLGPLPGLGLALAVGVAYLFTGNGVCLKIATLSLLVNAFNLLPFHPLDGGRLVFDVLLCRSRHLEMVFKLLSGGLLLLLGLVGHTWLIGGLGALVIFGSFDSFRLARAADRLRPILGGLSSVGSDRIPPEAAGLLFAAVRAEFPRLPDARSVAWRAASVWERLGTHPTGWLSGLALLGLQGLALLGSVIAVGAFFYFMTGTETLPVDRPDGTKVRQERAYRLHSLRAGGEGGLYDGQETVHDAASNLLLEDGWWQGGRRDGEWKQYDADGQVRSVTVFDRGKFVSCRERAGEAWVDKKLDDLPAARRQELAEQEAAPPQGPAGKTGGAPSG